MEKRTIKAKVGETVEVALKGAGATGYVWRCITDPEQVTLVERNVEPDESAFGAKGKERFLLRARRSGATELTFVLESPWDKDRAATESMLLEVEE